MAKGNPSQHREMSGAQLYFCKEWVKAVRKLVPNMSSALHKLSAPLHLSPSPALPFYLP